MKFSLQLFQLIILGLTFSVEAQNNVRVYDAETLEPLPFAHVRLTEIRSDKTLQTITDERGSFEIPFQEETRIELSYVGYQKLDKNIQPKRSTILYAFALVTKVEEVVVTANPTETNTKESMYEVRVIDKEELQQRAAVNLSDALMNELNMQISRDGVLGSQVNLQGLGGNNVKVMIDGVPVIGRLDGNLDLSQINMNNIERIEIVEGPLSAIYGSNALAGVINLITKQNQKNSVEAFVNTYYESIGTYNVDALVGYKKNKHFVQLSGGRYFFDGWNPNEYDRDVSWNPKEQYFAGLNYVVRSEKDWFHKFKGNYFQDKILNRYDPAGAIPVAFDDWYYTKRIDGNYSIIGKINENLSFNSTNAYNNYNRIKNKYQKNLTSLDSNLVPDSEYDDNQDTTIANQWMTRTFISYQKPEQRFGIQAGTDINIENGKGGRFSEEDGSSIVIADIAFFASINIQINEKLNLQPALRYAYNSQFKVLPTPSLQFKYAVTERLTYRFNYGMGFRAPSLKEQYLVFNDANHNIFGNQDLVPEQSQNVSSSISYDHQKNLHKYEVSGKVFYNYKYNAIALTPDDNGMFQYMNITDFTTMGAQINGKYKFKNFRSNFGFSYTGISNTSYKNQESNPRFFFYPQVQANFSYFFRKANLSLSIYNKWNGSRKDFRLNSLDNRTEQITIEGYNLIDFTVQKGFWENRISINAGIKNILNVANINGSSSSGAHSGNEGTQIAAGRTYFVGIKIGSKN